MASNLESEYEGKKGTPHGSNVKRAIAQHKAGHTPHLTSGQHVGLPDNETDGLPKTKSSAHLDGKGPVAPPKFP